VKGENMKMETEKKGTEEPGLFRTIYEMGRGMSFREKINFYGGPIAAYALV
jgi:hypothetical protein